MSHSFPEAGRPGLTGSINGRGSDKTSIAEEQSMGRISIKTASEVLAEVQTAMKALRAFEAATPGLPAADLVKLAQMRVDLQQLAKRLSVGQNLESLPAAGRSPLHPR
jgi:hypothetical protein